MMNHFLWRLSPFCLPLVTMGLMGCSPNPGKTMFTDTESSEFKVGQVWNYKARPGEDSSTLVVLKVETAPGWSNIIHIGVVGLKIKSPKGTQDTIPHMPFDEAAVKKSVTTKASEKGKLTNFQEGYRLWNEAASSGKGGVFTISVAEAVAAIEGGLNQAQRQ
jgi:hypothetical protein